MAARSCRFNTVAVDREFRFSMRRAKGEQQYWRKLVLGSLGGLATARSPEPHTSRAPCSFIIDDLSTELSPQGGE